MKADAVMDHVVTQLIEVIETGAGTWSMPWRTSFTMPTNATTGVGYRGGNVIMLWMTGMDRAYPTQLWATYKQWLSIDRQVTKGQQGTHLVKWARIKRVQPDGTKTERMIPNGFVVFNESQLDGSGEAGYEIDLSDVAAGTAEMSSDLSTVPAIVLSGSPAYHHVRDHITMPAVTSFDSFDEYLATFAHELAHWTGHHSRLSRDLSSKFGSDGYAMEELVAELSAAFTCAQYGVRPADRSDHASYIQHWCRVLRAEPGVLWTLASKAQAATDHLRTYATGVASGSCAA